MKRILNFTIIACMLCLFLVSCNKEKEKTVIVETTTEKVETTKNTTAATIKKELNPDIRLSIKEKDKKTSYNVVTFGKYDTEIGRSGKIEWLVVDKNDSSYLLISRYIIDCKNYNDSDIEVLWNNSTLNKWLNNYFLNSSFSSDEIAYMMPVNEFNLLGKEKVGLLNIASCQKYFGHDDVNKRNYKLSAEATTFAKSNWEEVVENKNSEYYNCGSFFLTDNGTTDRKAAWVGQYGHIYIEGQPVKLDHGDGVRPVLVVKKEIFGENDIIESAAIEETTSEEIEESSAIELESTNNEASVEKSNELVFSNQYSNYSKEKYQSKSIPLSKGGAVELYDWEYGRTPITWVYVLPNTQLISNNSPNMSPHFSYKVGATSGTKGCYMSIFSKGESKGDDWDGRLYTVEDYTKSDPMNLDFDPIFDKLTYGEYNVKELLSKRYNIEDVTPGLIKANGVYVNIVYISELDDIIANLPK